MKFTLISQLTPIVKTIVGETWTLMSSPAIAVSEPIHIFTELTTSGRNLLENVIRPQKKSTTVAFSRISLDSCLTE
jgi:hypothetical protein